MDPLPLPFGLLSSPLAGKMPAGGGVVEKGLIAYAERTRSSFP